MNSRQTNDIPARRSRRRRRTYLINPAFQWKYTGFVIVGVFIVSVFLSYVLFGVLHQQARARVVQPTVVSAWENTATMLLASAAFSAALGAALGLWTIIFTHRICGPLFVIQRYLADLTAGRFPHRRALRKRDEFKGLYAAFWDAVDALQKTKRSELKHLSEALHIAQAAEEGDDQARRHALASLTSRLEPMCLAAAHSLGEEFTGVGERFPAKPGTPADTYATVSA